MKTAARRSTADFQFTLDERRTNQVRLLLANAILLTTDDRLLSSRVAMVGAELMDCAMKAVPGTEISLSFRVDSNARAVRLDVETSTATDAADELEKLIVGIGSDDEREVYIRALKKAQDEGPASLELRLARIRFEGKMSLRCERGALRQLRIIAETPVSGTPNHPIKVSPVRLMPVR